MFKDFILQCTELYSHRSVLKQLIRQQLILRYRRTALGFLWTLINPLLMMSVTAVVFSKLFNYELKTYAVFLFAGMIPWNCFSSSVIQCSSAFISNEGLIKKIYLPKTLFPLSVATGVLIDSVLSFIALFVMIVSIGGNLSWQLLFIPFAFLLLYFFTLGIALIFSIATVFFRDLQYIITVAMQALFFLTPVMYKKEMLEGKVGWLVGINPLVPFIELFRAPLNSAALPSLSILISACIFTLISMVIGLIVFMKFQKKIVFRL
ncbi:MAG: ABC transporter permease [Undibacterium sp.]|uniref:ABC transporter permease n=1 Tax=Undibacterium sp. TaxID=1914977 RepID=UPI00271F4615|nr:ABC transporter permease [Undibacterium sp.]MDO8654640.1 ABC transporter permease [Undibacterium sp.]